MEAITILGQTMIQGRRLQAERKAERKIGTRHVKSLFLVLASMLLIGLSGCVKPPQLLSGSAWRTYIATKTTYEKMPSFSERERFAAEFPYWEPLDSGTLARINVELKDYRPWKPNIEELEDSFPMFVAGCRDADAHGNYYFEFPLDTIVKYSPFRGARADVIDLECYSLASGNFFMLKGTTQTGKEVKIYLGGESDGTCYVMADNQYYIRQPGSGEESMQTWLGGWRPQVIPPPLPNWPRRFRELYEHRQGK